MQKNVIDDSAGSGLQSALQPVRIGMQKGDVFDVLFQDPQIDTSPELESLTEFVYRGSSFAESLAPVGKTDECSDNSAGKKKATYYLSEKVLVELYDAKAKIKILVPPGLKSRVSMSRIVDYAVGAILEEFKSVGKESDLFKQMIYGSGDSVAAMDCRGVLENGR